MIKKVFSYFFVLILLAAAFCVPVSAYEPAGFEISAEAGMLVSMDTGEVLYEKNIDEKVYPASITKIMTATLILESDRYKPQEKIAMTEEVDPYITGTGSAVSNLKVGEEITQLDLIYTIVMSSFGDCAYLGAIYYGGTVEHFVSMMNAKAKELGLKGTHYSNPVGLHDEGTYTTVRDVRTLTEYALKNDTFKAACEATRYKIAATNMHGERTLSTTNYLHDPNTNYYYQYASGIKTGFTDEAGRCLVSTASYNGYRYLCILMNCPNLIGNRREFIESKELYRWAFNTFEFKQVADGDNPVCEMPVELSMDTDHVPLYIENGFVTLLPTDADMSTVVMEFHLKADSVDAPIRKGEVLGTATVKFAEREIGTVNLVAGESVEKSNLLLIVRTIKQFFTSWFMKIVLALVLIAVVAFVIAVIRLNLGRRRKRRVRYIPYRDGTSAEKQNGKEE